MQRVKLVVSGDAQGIGYHVRCWELANHYSLTGYAKNLSNGNVEVYIEGDEKAVEDQVASAKHAWLHRES